MTTFWSMFRESVVMQGLLTVMLWAAIIYLVLTGQPVPDLLVGGGGTVLGFWFGSKKQVV